MTLASRAPVGRPQRLALPPHRPRPARRSRRQRLRGGGAGRTAAVARAGGGRGQAPAVATRAAVPEPRAARRSMRPARRERREWRGRFGRAGPAAAGVLPGHVRGIGDRRSARRRRTTCSSGPMVRRLRRSQASANGFGGGDALLARGRPAASDRARTRRIRRTRWFGPGSAAGGPFGGRGGRGNQIRGSVYQSFDTSALDAAPFALNGQPTVKPDYFQQRLGATLGGPLVIPKVVNSPRTFFFRELHRQSLAQSVRRVLDGADAGRARR